MRALLFQIKGFVQEEDSPAMVEYGFLLALIALVAAVAVTAFGGRVKENLFDEIAAFISNLI
jgi:Flp pilus assembly pilin Flp